MKFTCAQPKLRRLTLHPAGNSTNDYVDADCNADCNPDCRANAGDDADADTEAQADVDGHDDAPCNEFASITWKRRGNGLEREYTGTFAVSSEDVRVTVENGKSDLPAILMEYPAVFSRQRDDVFRDSGFHPVSLVVRSKPHSKRSPEDDVRIITRV